MSLGARCGTCSRELLLDQVVEPFLGFRCPFCGTPFAPSYATVAPAVAARVLAARADLTVALAELRKMTGERLQLDHDALLRSIAEAAGAQPGRV